MNMYFNHIILENSNRQEVVENLTELIMLNDLCKEKSYQLIFYSGFWEIKVGENYLSQCLPHLFDKDTIKVLGDIIQNGPFFKEFQVHENIQIDPDVGENDNLKLFLNNCYFNQQKSVLSLTDEVFLKNNKYEIHVPSKAYLVVENIIGKTQLEKYIKDNTLFKNISEVFTKIQEEFEGIVILDNAIKSSKKHNFRGYYQDVYEGIKALYDIELPNLLDGFTEEERIEYFKKNTNSLEISKESQATMKYDRYREQREFKIKPNGKKEDFQWHIKINGKHTRVHYYIDKQKKKIYIGHCGKHLDTADYNS